MKQTRTEVREVLQSDTEELLHNSWYEYSDDKPLPTEDRDELIDAIIDLMIAEGHAIEDVEPNIFSLPDLAREMGINPKVARDKFRKAKEKPATLKITGWVFDYKDRETVANIIRPRRKK